MFTQGTSPKEKKVNGSVNGDVQAKDTHSRLLRYCQYVAFPLHFLYISFTLLSRDLQRNTDARLTQRLIRRIQRCRRTRNLARHGDSDDFNPTFPTFVHFVYVVYFVCRGRLINILKQRTKTHSRRTCSTRLDCIHIEVPRPPLDHGTWSSTQGNDSLVTVGSTRWELSITVVVVVASSSSSSSS